MTDRTAEHLSFAVFPDLAKARVAEEEVHKVVPGEVELLTRSEEITPRKVPIGLTMARVGMILGASLVAGATLLAVAGIVAIAIETNERTASYRRDHLCVSAVMPGTRWQQECDRQRLASFDSYRAESAFPDAGRG